MALSFRTIQQIKARIRPTYLRLLSLLPMPLRLELDFFRAQGYWPNLKNPKTFNEKVVWRTMFERDMRLPPLVDKIKVKEFIGKKYGEELIIPTLQSYDSADELDFTKPPLSNPPYVLKLNHGSEMNVYIRDLSFDQQALRKKLAKFLKTDHTQIANEWAYSLVKRKIFVEPLVESADGYLTDYKFHTFAGKVYAIEKIIDRYGEHRENLYDRDWNLLKASLGKYPRDETHLEPPARLNDMIQLAETMAHDFSYVRVDLYEVANQIKFGELTFYPGGGHDRFYPQEWDQTFGEQWKNWDVLPPPKGDVTNLRRHDSNPIPEGGPAEIRLTMIVRNEAERLPWMLQYYRNMGAVRFFIVDNGSEDGTMPYLLQQKDCHVYSTDESFAASHFGVTWQQELISRYGENHWWVVADADEMLVYPGCETVLLPALCAYLDSVGAQGLYTPMIDMYSRGPVSEAVYHPGRNFLETCPYFDSDYIFRSRLFSPFSARPIPDIEPIGGPRLRLFYPEFRRGGLLAVVGMKLLRKFRDMMRQVGINLNLPCPVPPLLFKIPVFKSRKGFEFGRHYTTSPIRLAEVTGALLHFKFFSDFHDRVLLEVKRGEHFDGASEYARYLKFMHSNPNALFFFAKSVKYRDSMQLVGLNLIRDTPSFAEYRANYESDAGLAAAATGKL